MRTYTISLRQHPTWRYKVDAPNVDYVFEAMDPDTPRMILCYKKDRYDGTRSVLWVRASDIDRVWVDDPVEAERMLQEVRDQYES